MTGLIAFVEDIDKVIERFELRAKGFHDFEVICFQKF